MNRRSLLVPLSLALVISGCRAPADLSARREPADAPRGAPPEVVLEPSPPPVPPRTVRIRVPGDLPAVYVPSSDGTPPRIVFLPGVCSSALGYVQAIQGAGNAHGGVVGLDGDDPCPGNPAYRTFKWDATRLHGRIEAALAAAGRSDIPSDGIVLVGYSQGAHLGEQLVARHPERYARVVLIGAPKDPAEASFGAVRGVVMMSCQHDVTARMRAAAARIDRAGTPASYLEMPGCRHGQMNDAERIFGEAFTFLDTRARPVRAERRATAIVGRVDEG